MIGIFDSGIGGVTVLNKIIQRFPNYKYLYYSDSINNPYGDKSKEELLEIVKKIISYLINKGSQIIVIGCNTVSTICYDELVKEFSIPIIKIEPPSKRLLGKTLIMATSGTINSKRFKEIIKNYDEENTFICKCSGLADLIEKNNKKEIKNFLNKNISKFRGVDNIVLGCTHYPLIKKEIENVLGNVIFYDGSEKVINELEKYVIKIKESDFEINFIDSSYLKIKEERFYQELRDK